VESEEWLGALLHANDELVTALMTFEQLDRSIDADSDSDDEMAEQAHLYKREYSQMHTLYMLTSPVASERQGTDTAQQLAGLHLGSKSKSPVPENRPAPPPRPVPAPAPEPEEEEDFEEEDENDPFADRNALETPVIEKSEPRW
jgi:hypothetical protein